MRHRFTFRVSGIGFKEKQVKQVCSSSEACMLQWSSVCFMTPKQLRITDRITQHFKYIKYESKYDYIWRIWSMNILSITLDLTKTFKLVHKAKIRLSTIAFVWFLLCVSVFCQRSTPQFSYLIFLTQSPSYPLELVNYSHDYIK